MKSWHVILILILCLLCFVTGRYTKKAEIERVCETDTFIYVDTIRDSIPYPIYETLIQTVPELFPIYITLDGDTVHDSIYVSVPVTQKEYLSDNYHVWVSGYKPSLDSIDIFPKTMYITKYKPARRWGIGVMAGYGIGRNGLSPYVGVGIYYRVW